jgi:hypothetical protein
MKKLLLILAFTLQFVNAQNTIVGEYISTTKNSNGVKLYFFEDNTYQISVFSGKYKIENDSIILENDSKENSFNLLFEKGKKPSNKVTVKATPYNYYSLFSSEYLGIQKTENSEIEYKAFKDYFDENDLEEYTESVYKAVENADENTENKAENPETKLSFEIDRAYALYFVKYKERKSNIEKYIIPTDVNTIDVTIHDNYLSDLELSGKVENDKSVIFLTDGKSPLSFIKKNAVKKIDYVVPSIKSSEKKWTFPGMKNRDDYYDYDSDSTAVVVDTAMAYTTSDYKFNAKVEKNLKEALMNLKKEPAKYLFVYYNLKGKKTEKDFNKFIEDYNRNVGYNMYSEYDATYDKFNFYLATGSDEANFKKNGIIDKSLLILNKDGKIIASSTKSLDDIVNAIYYDTTYLLNKLLETENAIALANSIANKKTSVPELTKNLNTNYKDFFTANYYYNNSFITVNDETEVIAVEDPNMIAVDSAATVGENDDFKYYKSEVSEKLLSEKLNVIFEYYNSKNIVDNQLINILLGEISENHNSFDLFNNKNNTYNKQEIKYINYILKYNGDQKNKAKIAIVLNGLLSQKEANNPDIKAYNAIATSLISYSGNNFGIIQNEINNFNAKEKGSEDANKLVDLYYNILVNDKPVFENLDTQFNNLSTEVDYTMDWAGYKNRVNSMLNEQAWDIFELGKTKDFERAIKWSELSNIVEKDNPYSLDTLGQLYFAVGRKSEAIVIQTKAVALAKTMGISHEEFEEALNNMKK